MSEVPPQLGRLPISNSAVVEAMNSVGTQDTPDARSLLYRLILETRLLALSPAATDGPSEWTAKAGDTLALKTLREGNEVILPLFTDEEAILRWNSLGSPYVALSSRAIFEMADANGTARIDLNPGSSTRGSITRHEIQALARGRIPLGTSEVTTEDTEVKIGLPSTPPPNDAIKAIRRSLSKERLALRAWYFLMQQGSTRPEIIVAVQFQDGSPHDARALAMRSIIDNAGTRSEFVKSLVFLEADAHWVESMTRGSGQEFYPK